MPRLMATGIFLLWALLSPHALAEENTGLPAGTPPPASHDGPPMTDIHDIKPPHPAGPDVRWLYRAAAGLAAAALIALAFVAWKNRHRRLRAYTAPSLSPEEAAGIALRELSDVASIPDRMFYFRLSAVLRHYIRGRFGVNAPEMTTEELIPHMEAFGLDKEMKQAIRSLFAGADSVKFAAGRAHGTDMARDLDVALRFVEAVRPRPVPENAGPPS